MGIRQLATNLSPFGEQALFRSHGRDGGDEPRRAHTREQPTRVVIDGPALAYHVYHKLLACRPVPLHALLAAQPTYDEIGRATLVYLQKLEECGILIHGIFFDGQLPPKKKPVRIERLEACLKQVVAYGSVQRVPPPTAAEAALIEQPLAITAAVLFPGHVPPTRSAKALPAAPFLVPAVLDALAASRFAEATRVVPGEADAFCAQAARERGGGLVLTSDSDLLVHELGDDGAVAFLGEVELRQDGEGGDDHGLEARLFRPREVAGRLQIEGVARLAWELRERCPIPFGEALKRARTALGGEEERDAFGAFMDEYRAVDLASGDDDVICLATADGRPTFLDPRVSELVLQSRDARTTEIDMYLPFLIEDPSRFSAWAPSASVRHLVYSLLVRSGACVHEHARKGVRIVAEDFTAWSPQHRQRFTLEVSKNVTWATAMSHTMSLACAWRMLCVSEIVTWHLDSGRTLPPLHAVQSVLEGNPNGLRSESAFLWAQVQGYIYSVRMLQQVLHLSARTVPDNVTAPLKKLCTDLTHLPQLATLLASPRQVVPRPPNAKTQIDHMLLFKARQEQSAQEKAHLRAWAEDARRKRSRTSRKEKAPRRSAAPERETQVDMSNNRYGLLANA